MTGGPSVRQLRRPRGPYRITPEQRAARTEAKREKQVRRIDRILNRVGLDLVMERIVCRFGFKSPLVELDILARRTPGRDIVEIVIDDQVGAGWGARVLDRLTALAEAAE
jgi:hypothetical protein